MSIINGMLAATLAVASGTGLSFYAGNDTLNQNTVIQEQGVRYNEVTEMMETTNLESMQLFMEHTTIQFDEMQKFMEGDNRNFGQMKPYMSEMHPNLDNSNLKEIYKGMHGTGGSSQSSNFEIMNNM
ncbi:hypothetical protein [Carnobacterium funditum]|uniref:hypothetical protein n=1 Tax=Carnobacterium funditum TaxID=2752 RepID=UPI00054EDF3D|nr:hypothetical protein [Carnobacterium funditum]